MTASVFCHGCGQRLDVPAGYQRRKMRCPQCGVMCELPGPTPGDSPAPRPARRPARDLEAAAEEVLLEPDAERTCSRCGAALPASGPETCPRCTPSAGIKPAAERVGVRPARPAPAPPAEERAGPGLDDEDAYGVVGSLEELKCPGCRKALPADAVVCAACGFNRETGKKPPKVYEPLERHWEAGLTLRSRILVFVAFQAVALPLGLFCSLAFDEVPGFLCCWLVGTVMAAFLLGTYDRVDLARNKRGRITLTKTWRVCFVARPPDTIRVSDHEGVVTGRSRDVGFWDWFILFMLLPMGLIPAVVWYFYTINHDSFQVALCRDHGYPETVLYRGWSQEHMRDIARTLSEAAEMPWDGG